MHASIGFALFVTAGKHALFLSLKAAMELSIIALSVSQIEPTVQK